MRSRWVLRNVALIGLVIAGAFFIHRYRLHVSEQLLRQSPTGSAPMSVDAQGRRPNRLIHEKSPYLLQHAYNPVDWYPWGEEAFAKAKQEEKPVFLSIGYSTCYWCHVMERESFEHPEIAKALNASFVPIKVDREERPDLDALYMTAVQALSGQGGWPMTVFLTPEGKPFWGGTYFPPEDRGGRPGLPRILSSISEAWRRRREELLRSSQELTHTLQASAQPNQAAQLTTATLDSASQQLAQQFDATDGGFGQAPKFPRPHALSLLLRMWFRERDPKLLDMVDTTLEAMARGGIHDQLGGGFHRYSTDAQWLVPHFEKMLYDQALIARAYLEAYQVTGKPHYAEVARDIFEYVLRDLRDPQGGFYAAEDAGEVGKEGDFYVWTSEEVTNVLGKEEARVFGQLYDVTPEGNFSPDSGEPAVGGESKNILHIKRPLEDLAKLERLDVEALRASTAAAQDKLLAVRSQRQRPHLDDKILTDWNGLVIGALAYGARVLNEPRYAQAAREAAEFLLAHLQQNGRLLHRYRDGEAKIPAFLDDYAFLSWGLLDLYESTYEAKWLAEAKRLSSEMTHLFWDDQHGGFFLSGELNERLIAKTKELYDGAVPSGNSAAALVLAHLAALTMDQAFEQHLERFFQAFANQISQAPHAFPQGLIALDRRLGPSQEIVIAGDPARPETQAMLRAVHGRFLPRAVVALHPIAEEPAKAIERLIPFIKEQQPLQGKTTVYVCQNYICTLPTTDLNKLTALLDALR